MFRSDASQVEVYNGFARKRVAAVLAGSEATIIAYGQTGAGKTHTMIGPDPTAPDGMCESMRGVVPRAAEQIFDALQCEGSRLLAVRVAYLEIYNNNVKDLLAPEAKCMHSASDPIQKLEASLSGTRSPDSYAGLRLYTTVCAPAHLRTHPTVT